MAGIFFLAWIGAFFYGIYALIRFLMARNDKEASEETKEQRKKRCLIAAAVFVVGVVGHELSVPKLTPEEKAAQEEQRRIETAAREAKKAEEAKQEAARKEQEAKQAEERRVQEAQRAEEKRRAEAERKAREDAEKKAAAEQKAKDDMMKELTTGWNTENTNADEDNTNFQKAGDLIKKYPDYLRQAEAISPAPQSMLKKPWDYYGKAVELTGMIYSVEQLPPGDSIVKFFHKDCCHAMFVPAGDDVTFSLYIVGASDNLQDNMTVTARGFTYGHIGLVNTQFGGTSKGVGMIGFVE